MGAHKSSWKDKIDPAFDKLIKYYIQLLDETGMPSNSGWIILEDEYYKIWEQKGMQGWIQKYEKDITKEDIAAFKFATQKGIPEKERNKKRKDFQKRIFDKIRLFPEESQEYYKKAFEPFYSKKNIPDYFSHLTLEWWKNTLRDFFVDLFVFELHAYMIELGEEFRRTPKEKLQKDFSKPSNFLMLWLNSHDSVSRLVFGKTFPDLMKEAKKGNEDSFFNVLQIDRTVIECEWAQKKIRKAQLTANEDFFKKMAAAITTPPLENNRVYGRTVMILLLFWRLGLYRLENSELIDLLEGCGVRIQDDPETFRKFVNRLITEDFKKSIVTFHKENTL